LHFTRVFADSLKPIPEPWGLLIGDAIHNYRSALDHLAFALVRAGSRANVIRDPKRVKRIYFPYFGEALAIYPNKWVADKLPGVDTGYVKALAPFQSGLRPGKRRWQLRALQRLDDLEKHREPLLTHHAIIFTNLITSTPSPAVVQVVPGWDHIKAHTEFVRFVWQFGKAPFPTKHPSTGIDFDNPGMGVKFQPTCGIAFGDLKPRREVRDVLAEFSAVVRKILQAVEAIGIP
jgi:hypothetical protein